MIKYVDNEGKEIHKSKTLTGNIWGESMMPARQRIIS